MAITLDVDVPWLWPEPTPELHNDQIVAGDTFAVADERGKRSFGIWRFDGEFAERVDLAGGARPSRIAVAEADIAKGMRSAAGLDSEYFTVQKLELAPGAFYPGMARTDARLFGSAAFQAPDYMWRGEELTSSLLQLRSLFQSLESIFQVVHPAEQNLKAFGSSIRDLLILASTECEAQWAAVLRLNKYPNSRPTRRDYSKLGPPMKLNQYTVILRHYRAFQSLTPFSGWDGLQQHAPLPWYDDYNAVKHDRAGSFPRATLESAVNAVAACWVMIAAQFGYRALREFPDLNDKLKVWYAPRWRLAQCYVSDRMGFSPDAEVAYPF